MRHWHHPRFHKTYPPNIQNQPYPTYSPVAHHFQQPSTPFPKAVDHHSPDTSLFEEITQQMKELYNKLEEVEEEKEELKEKVENIKTLNIENINYKIQELTVEELSGNLLIGMSSLADEMDAEKLMEDKENIQFNDIDTTSYEQDMEALEFKNNEEGTDENE